VYIGEGGKTNNFARIINSDPKVINLILKWFKMCFEVKNSQFIVRLHIYPDNNETECIKYWSGILKIPIKQFSKSTIDVRTNKKQKKRRKLSFGTAHITIKSFGNKEHGAYLLRRILAWINLVL
ncbi:MAG: hypothetical protein WAW92_00255, partial [Minisyncoccia bacterium]